MYRTRNFGWKLMHILAILVHLSLTTASAISYAYNHGQNRAEEPAYWSYLRAADGNPCHRLALSSRVENWVTPNQTSIMACLAVGTIGLAVNVVVFTILLTLETNNITLTEGEQHWRRQVATFSGCVSNLLLAGAGVGLVVNLGTDVIGSKLLIAPLVWASIQAPLALATAALDAAKTYREGKDLLD
ncbi:hypothetical protein BT67DRAFT_437109 [Trichocladium antarcticum]|uniref:Uncharacterized protein n=1 Tax=Trichocladium antarcticum TaxID=1450529 RepID=A0AAN6UC65_9PEZI|nr:hypothetical protein BT67DRAFT_437109 [Trichocladium antarcticum]